MALQTCDKHETSDGEIAIVVYESYHRSYSVAKCPMCELELRIEKIKSLFFNVQQKIWDVVGECGTGITDREKIDQIESILLDSEKVLP